MRLLTKLLPVLCISGAIISSNALANETVCRDSYMGDKFQVAQVDDENAVMCIYSASAMYPVIGKFKPVLRSGSRWKSGHGGWYCRPTSKDPKACKFKAI